jgi:hypothetical protein
MTEYYDLQFALKEGIKYMNEYEVHLLFYVSKELNEEIKKNRNILWNKFCEKSETNIMKNYGNMLWEGEEDEEFTVCKESLDIEIDNKLHLITKMIHGGQIWTIQNNIYDLEKERKDNVIKCVIYEFYRLKENQTELIMRYKLYYNRAFTPGDHLIPHLEYQYDRNNKFIKVICKQDWCNDCDYQKKIINKIDL